MDNNKIRSFNKRINEKNSNRKKRQRARRFGIWTEILAANFLRLKGYKILARNYRNKHGEIDIIARKKDLIIVVEVKARKSLTTAVDAVGYKSRQRIINAANIWLGTRPDWAGLSIRFDIIAICPRKWPIHLKDAF